MSTISHLRTYADLERKRDDSDARMELIEGEVLATPSPTPFHQFVSQRLYDLLKEAVVNAGIGRVAYAPLDVVLDEQTVLQPDLIVLLRDAPGQIGELNIFGAPSLVEEIVSPSTANRDRGVKRGLYARHGVPEYWLVDPEARSVTIYSSPDNGKYRQSETTITIASSTHDSRSHRRRPRAFRTNLGVQPCPRFRTA